MPRGGPPKQLSSLLPSLTPVPPADEPTGLVDSAGIPITRDQARDPAKRLVSPRYTALSKSGPRIAPSRKSRRAARAKTLDKLAVIGGEINTPPLPEDAIAFIATFLVHATLPYKDPGDVDLWTRSSGKITITFERGHTPPDHLGRQRKVGLPFGIYPRLIFSWLSTEAVRTREPVLSLGRNFTEWVRDGLHVTPTGGEKGTITAIREQMTRMLAMKVTITTHDTVKHQGKDKILSASFSVVPVAGEAAFWDPEQPNQHDLLDPHLRLGMDFFNEAVRSSVPFDERVQIALAKQSSCMAIDLYRLLTLKQFALFKARAKTPELIPWDTLSGLLGQDNKRHDNFRTSVAAALQLVLPLYPECKTEARHGGLLIRPGAPHIPPKPKKALPTQMNLEALLPAADAESKPSDSS